MRRVVSGFRVRAAGAMMLATLANPASAEKVDPDAYPALAAEVILPPIIANLKRTLPDPYSIRDFVLCRPYNIHLKDGVPTSWAVMISFNAKNTNGGYSGIKIYIPVFRDGHVSGDISSITQDRADAFNRLFDNAMEKKMAGCPAVPDEQIQVLLKVRG
jgi:hypothetical protein